MKDITGADYCHAKRVWKDFEIKHLDEYHDLFFQSDTLLLADIFENFQNKCFEIYELDPVYFLSTPGLAWQACIKNRSRIIIINWYWYVVNGRKTIS